MDYSDVRYLLAKQTVDDRALNRRVAEGLKGILSERRETGELRVLELGAGVGTMVARLAEWDLIASADFTLVDLDATSLAAARAHLERWADRVAARSQGAIEIERGGKPSRVRFVCEDVLAFLAKPEHQRHFDVVVANAVLDVLDLEPALKGAFGVLRPNSAFWFSINFDGETILLPEHPLDERIMPLYHRTMDERVRDGRPCGDSKTGRHLLQRVPALGAALVAAGSSDWVVFPSEGRYPADEAYFLHHIVHTIDTALRGHPELEPEFGAWVAQRHAEIERGQLTYIAHQLDLVGRS